MSWLEILKEHPEYSEKAKTVMSGNVFLKDTGSYLSRQAASDYIKRNQSTQQPTLLKSQQEQTGRFLADNAAEFKKARLEQNRGNLYQNRAPVFPNADGIKPTVKEASIENTVKNSGDFWENVTKGREKYDIQRTGNIGVTNTEAETFSYLLGKYGHKKAHEYLSEIKPRINARESEQQLARLDEMMKANKGAALAYNLLSAPASGLSYIGAVGQAAKNAATGRNDNIDTNSSMNAFAEMQGRSRDALTDNMGGVGKLLTDTALSMGQNLTTRLLTKNNEIASLALMALSAAGQKTLENAKKGVPLGENIADSTLSGAIEAATEKISFGGLNKLLKTPSGNAAEFLQNVAKQMGSEGAEELIAEYGNAIIDNLILKNNSDYNQYVKQLTENGMSEGDARRKATIEFYVKNPALAALGGAISGAGFGTVGATGGYINTKNEGARLNTTGEARELINSASDGRYGDRATKMAQDIQLNQLDGREAKDIEVGNLQRAAAEYLQNQKEEAKKNAARAKRAETMENIRTRAVDFADGVHNAAVNFSDGVHNVGAKATDSVRNVFRMRGKDGAENTNSTKTADTARKTETKTINWNINGVKGSGEYVGEEIRDGKRFVKVKTQDGKTAEIDASFVSDSTVNADAEQSEPRFRMRRMYDDTLDEGQKRVFEREAQGGGKYNATATAQTAEQTRAQTTAQKFGHRVVFYEGSDNGFIKDDTVYISKDAENPVMSVLGHELTHAVMADESIKKELVSFVRAQTISEDGALKGDYSDRFNKKKQLYQSRMENVTDDYILEEITADIGGDLFMSDEFINRITEEKPNIAVRIWRSIKDFIARVTGNGRYKDLSGSEIKQLRDAAKAAQKYEQAFIKARENMTAANGEAKYDIVTSHNRKETDNNIYDYTKSFAEQIDDWKQGKIPQTDSLMVGATPDVLKKIGFNALPVTINQTHVDYAINGTKDTDHNLGETLLGQLPQALENPVAVIKSQTQSNRVVAILKMQHNKKNVVAAVEIDGFGTQNNTRIDSNAIVSVFGKSNAITKQLIDALNSEANGNTSIFYWNKKEALSLLQRPGLQLPNRLPQDGFIHSIREKGSNVKLKFENVTETTQFKRWFGDWENNPNKASKVVNEDGTPRVMYHQTANDFTVFDTSKEGAGYYDSETPTGIFLKPTMDNIGLSGDKQMSLYANIRNPMKFADRSEAVQWYKNNIEGYKDLSSELENTTKKYEKIYEEAEERSDKWYEENYEAYSKGKISEEEATEHITGELDKILSEWKETENSIRRQQKKLLDSYFKNSKYDGMIISKDEGSFGRDVETFIAFNPEQVKSATDNIGTFDKNNTDIRYKLSSSQKTARFNSIADKFVAETGTTLERGEVSAALENIYNTLSASDYSAAAYTQALEDLKSLSRSAFENTGTVKDDTLYKENADLRQYLRTTAIAVNDSAKEDFGSKKDFNDFRRANFGRIRISNSGTPVDIIYNELSELYPQFFDESREMTQSDQLKRIAEVLRSIQPTVHSAYEGVDIDALVDSTADELFSSMLGVIGENAETGGKKKKVSRFRTNTIERAVMFSEEDLKNISPEEFEYIPETVKEWNEQAVKNVSEDMEGVMEKIRASENIPFGGVMAHEAALISNALTDGYHSTGSAADLAAMTDWFKVVSERTREAARFLKATDSAWEKSPAAAIAKAQSVVQEEQDKKENPKSKKAKERKSTSKKHADEVNSIQDSGVERIADEVEKAFGEKKEKKENPKSKKAKERKSTSKKHADEVNSIQDSGEERTADKKEKAFSEKKDSASEKESKPRTTKRQRIESRTLEKFNITKEKEPNKAAFVSKVLSDLFGKIRKTRKGADSGAKYSTAEQPKLDLWYSDIKAAIEGRGEYAEVWEEMYALSREEFAGDAKALSAIDDYFTNGKKPIVPLDALDKAINDAFSGTGINIGQVVRDYFSDDNQTAVALSDYIIEKTGVSGEDADELAKYVKERYRELVKDKQIKYLEREAAKLDKPRLVSTETIKRVSRHIDRVFSEEQLKEFEMDALNRVNPRIAEYVREKGINLLDVAKHGVCDSELDNYKYLDGLLEELDGRITEKDIKDFSEAVYREFAKMPPVRNDKVLSRYFKIDEGGMIVTKTIRPRTVLGDMLGLIDIAGKKRAGIVEEILKRNDGLVTLEQSDINAILNHMSAAADLDKDSREYKVEIARVKKIIEGKKQPSAGAAVWAYARINMLLNPKTILTRNFGGNLIQAGIYNIENTISTGIDKVISKKTGIRTSAAPTINNLKEQGKGFVKGAQDAWKDYKEGVDTRDFDGRYDIGEGDPFTNKNAFGRGLNKVNRLTGAILDVGDRPFYEMHYNSVLEQLKRANNVSEASEEMIEIAREVALERTWQDENDFTKTAANAKHLLNRVHLPGINYGAGDIVEPFVKTPANLFRATLKYSPAGLGKSLISDSYKLMKAHKDGTLTMKMQRKYVDDLSKAIVGTLITIIGYAIAKKGMFNGEDADDDKVQKFREYVEGIMPNSLKIGDYSVSLSWLQPMGAPLSFGATLENEMKKDSSFGSKLINAFANSMENVINASFIQGIRELLAGNYKTMFDKFLDAGKDGIIQMLPLGSLTKQLANSIDNTVRTTYAPTGKDKFANRAKQYYPGLSNTLEPRLNALGEQSQRTYDETPDKVSLADGAARVLNSFFNPANTRRISSTPLIKELNRVYDMTGDSSVYPTEAENKVTVDGKDYRLTSEQYTVYQRKVGTKIKDVLNALIVDDEKAGKYAGEKTDEVTVTYDQMTEEERKKKESSIKTKAAAEYKESIDKKNIKISDLSLDERAELKRKQEEAIERFRNGEVQTEDVVWSDVPYSQLDDGQKAEVLSSAIKKAREAVKEELKEDWTKNAQPVFKMRG